MTDEEVMAVLMRDDPQALAALVVRYQNDLYRFCLHYLRDVERAKEVTQETFVRVYVARGRFDRSRKFRPWVLCIARNLCLNELKRRKAVPMESLEDYASSAREDTGELFRSGADGPDEQLMTAERRQLVAHALEGLDPDSREIVVLRFFEHMQARDIAEIVGATEGAVRTRLHRILKVLQGRYQDCKNDI